MATEELYYTSTNGERTGRASYFFRDKDNAKTLCGKQNDKAELMKLDARYTVCATPATGIESKEIR